jgi:arylformamidase
MDIIDLSMTIAPMWRWPNALEILKDFKDGDPYRVSSLQMVMHAFTHVDTPLHIEPDRETIDSVDLSDLCGPAFVADMNPVEPNQEIGPELLSERCQGCVENDILLIKTRWDQMRDPTTREYWQDAPYISESGAAWLAVQKVKAVGFDFPQDKLIREIPKRHPPVAELPTHDLILRKGIYLIEYLCNLGALSANRVKVFALPLKVKGAEGACARVVALA